MKIKEKHAIHEFYNFEGYIEKIWPKIRALLVELYEWKNLPEKFHTYDCTISEYEDIPYATVHIVYTDYVISFKKDNFELKISISDRNEISVTHYTKLICENESENITIENFIILYYDSENPFKDKWLNMLKSLS